MKAIREARLLEHFSDDCARSIAEKSLFNVNTSNAKCTFLYSLVFNWDEAKYQYSKKQNKKPHFS